MVLGVSGGAVGFVSAENNGGGPLGPPRVLRVRFPLEWKSKIDIFGEVLQKSEGTANGQTPSTAAKGQGRANTVQISLRKFQI